MFKFNWRRRDVRLTISGSPASCDSRLFLLFEMSSFPNCVFVERERKGIESFCYCVSFCSSLGKEKKKTCGKSNNTSDDGHFQKKKEIVFFFPSLVCLVLLFLATKLGSSFGESQQMMQSKSSLSLFLESAA